MIWVYGVGFFASSAWGDLASPASCRALTGRLDPRRAAPFRRRVRGRPAHALKGQPRMTVAVFLFSLCGAMAIGMPVAFALIVCGLALMLHMGIFDSQIVSLKLIEGADNFQLLAVPFFLLAGELMNAGGLSKRIVNFAVSLRRPHPWRPRLRGDLRVDHHGVAVGLGRRRHGGDRRDPDPDDARGRLQRAALGRPDRVGRHHRAGDPALDRLHRLRRRGQRLDHPALPGRRLPGPADGPVAVIAWAIVVARARRSRPIRASPGRRALKAFVDGFFALLMPAIILGCIKFGWATPTEAAVFAAVYALFVGLFIYRELKFSAALRGVPGRGEDDGRRHVPGRRGADLGLADHAGQHPGRAGRPARAAQGQSDDPAPA